MSRKHLVPKHRKYGDHPLRMEMDKLGMTAREFAKYTGIDVSTIFNILAGKHTKRYPIIIQTIADACGVGYEEARQICQ